MCKPEGQLCYECRAPMQATVRNDRRFCSSACRAAWNNRRKLRGAELYDLVMLLHTERKAARAAKLWTVVGRMAAEYREEDQRAGVRSYAPISVVKERTVRFGVV